MLPGAWKRSHKTNKAMNAVSEWVQGHSTSSHLQVRAHLYMHAAKDIHIWTSPALSRATTGVIGTLQTP